MKGINFLVSEIATGYLSRFDCHRERLAFVRGKYRTNDLAKLADFFEKSKSSNFHLLKIVRTAVKMTDVNKGLLTQ